MPASFRRPLTAIVLFALAWVWGFPGGQQPAVQGLAHELVHLQSVAHHHQDDAHLQLDDATPAELSHHHAGDGGKPLAASVAILRSGGPLPSHVLVSTPLPHSLSVVLAGLLRPPSDGRA
jgi:hypothetical protein